MTEWLIKTLDRALRLAGRRIAIEHSTVEHFDGGYRKLGIVGKRWTLAKLK